MRDNEPVDYMTAQALVNCTVRSRAWQFVHGLDPVPRPGGGYVKPPLGPIPYLPPAPSLQ